MDKIKRKRVPTRSTATKLCSDVDAALKDNPVNIQDLKVYLERLELTQKKLQEQDENFIDALVEANKTDVEIETEVTANEEYLKKIVVAKLKIMDKLQRDESASGSGNSSGRASTSSRRSSAGANNGDATHDKKRYTLPKIALGTFNGEMSEWITFWAKFEKIHLDPELHDSDKFQHLAQAMEPGTRGDKIVRSFPMSEANYPKVISALKDRFGDENLLAELYMRKLIDLVKEKTVKNSSLVDIYDEVETQLRALESLGRKPEESAFVIFPLIESALPRETYVAWQRSPLSGYAEEKDLKPEEKLSALLKFLRIEVKGQERLAVAKQGELEKKASKQKKTDQLKNDSDIPTALDLYNGSTVKNCIFCDKSHPSAECFQARKMTLEKKRETIKNKRACFVCLNLGHGAKRCKSKAACIICGGRHHAIICPDLKPSERSKGKGNGEPSQPEKPATGLANFSNGTVFLQTLIVKLRGPKCMTTARAIVDTGSQRSYISRRAVEVLGLIPSGQSIVTHNLFGGSTMSQQRHGHYEVEVMGLDNNFKITLETLDQNKICGFVTRVQPGPWLEELSLQDINITDVGEEYRDISLLIGADYAGLLATGKIYVTSSGPVGVETKLGWTLMGSISSSRPTSDSSLMVTTLHVNNVDVQDLWKLDLIGIKENTDNTSKADLVKSASEHFLRTVKVNGDNRYEVCLPWITGHPSIPVNREIAERRLRNETRKLEATKMYGDYDKIFEEWEKTGIIEQVEDSSENCTYIPHRPVIKPESSTTPVRPVFDASVKTKGFPALNQCLETGPNLIELIPSLLVRFRMGKYGVISDIRKAFLQVSVREEDRDFLRFLWWEKDTKSIKVYRHCRVVFGLTSSPFLLGATINYHLNRVERQDLSDTVKLLRKSFYIDNLVVSLDAEEQVQKFVRDASRIMMEGKFELRGWAWNSKEGSEEVPVLGLNWNTRTDNLSLDLRSFLKPEQEQVTKRMMLSLAHRIFDPLGLVCPVTLIPKKLVQDVWKSKQAWDEQVPEEIAAQFEKWKSEIPLLKSHKIPRIVCTNSYLERSLHVFADASSVAYATVVFMRIVSADGVTVKLIMARNRLSTIKKITIPRLELLACLIAARLSAEVKEYLGLPDIATHYWTDSSNALHWITKTENWAEFVWNRVSEIRRLTAIDSWRHVPGKDNPADLPSRGCSVRQFLNSQWWEGPRWLYFEEVDWPKSIVSPNLEIVNSEIRKSVSCNMTTDQSSPWYAEFQDKNGMLDYIKVLWSLSIGDNNSSEKTALSHEDWRAGENKLFRLIQADMFNNGDKILQQLRAQKDDHGVWRVRTRITAREDLNDFLYPVLLKSTHPLTRALVVWEHKKMHHCGVGTLMTILRERFWIVGARRLARKVVHSCPDCRRFVAQKVYPEEGPLPLNRVRDAVVFEITGIDLGGPLYLENGDKGWFVVFTCAVYRAVHLELVLSLSTKALVGAMERFIARRICPAVIYSDNGTNLIGVRNEFQRKGVNIDWKLNPPAAPWWGGWWERVVGLVKKLLVRLLQHQVVNFEDMQTFLAKCEEAINSRPLTHLSDDPMDLTPLTPHLFLSSRKMEGIPIARNMTSCEFGEEYKKRQKLLSHFKKRFRDEYLSRLVHHCRKKPRGDLREGDLVMIELDNKKRLQWPLARVLELIKGQDGVCRVVRLKTDQGVLTRPVQRVYPLEVASDHQQNVTGSTIKPEEKVQDIIVSRSGREIKKPQRLGVN